MTCSEKENGPDSYIGNPDLDVELIPGKLYKLVNPAVLFKYKTLDDIGNKNKRYDTANSIETKLLKEETLMLYLFTVTADDDDAWDVEHIFLIGSAIYSLNTSSYWFIQRAL